MPQHIKNWLADNILVCLIGVVTCAFQYGIKVQLDNIEQHQLNSILASEARSDAKYVTRQDFSAATDTLKNNDERSARAVAAVAEAVNSVKTDVAVIKTELQKHN